MPNAVEVSISVLPEKLGKRLIAYLDLKHPYQRQRDELKRSIIFNALAEFLNREMPEKKEKENAN